jgi:23S rRNA (pseudouridine1915-N3)-methyltransferase
MHKIKIASVGKNKETWLEEACAEYIKRLQGAALIECIWVKTDEQLIAQAEKDQALICLDPNGVKLDSEGFASLLMQQLEEGGSRLTLIIGGAEGLPPPLKKTAKLISLSPMTFTHQITRLILIEQIYRAFEIHKGSRYHK